jgi:hypothetical protein
MSNETHILQVKCEQAATAVWNAVKGRCPVTVVAYYDTHRANGNTFVTTLDLCGVIGAVEALLERWRTGVKPPPTEGVWLPSVSDLPKLVESCQEALPFSVRALVMFGAAPDIRAATFTDREDMRKHLEEELLPHLRSKQTIVTTAESPQ